MRAKCCLLGESSQLLVSLSSTRCDQAGVCQFRGWRGGSQMVGTRKWGGTGSFGKSVVPVLSALQLRPEGKGCPRCAFCKLKYGLKECRVDPCTEKCRWKTNGRGPAIPPSSPPARRRTGRDKQRNPTLLGPSRTQVMQQDDVGWKRQRLHPASCTWPRLHQFPVGWA